MGDLEGLPLGACSAVAAFAGTVGHDGDWYGCIFTIFSPHSHPFSLEVSASIRTVNIQGVCVVYLNYPQLDAAALIYSGSGQHVQIGVVLTQCISAMFYDLLVLVLSVVGLSNERSESPLKRRLRAQGILYFVVAVIAYIPSMVWGFYPLPRTVFSLSPLGFCPALRCL